VHSTAPVHQQTSTTAPFLCSLAAGRRQRFVLSSLISLLHHCHMVIILALLHAAYPYLTRLNSHTDCLLRSGVRTSPLTTPAWPFYDYISHNAINSPHGEYGRHRGLRLHRLHHPLRYRHGARRTISRRNAQLPREKSQRIRWVLLLITTTKESRDLDVSVFGILLW
jgi:hypothetical protein